MTTLADFPMLNQLSDTTEINRQFDCVPTCIAACLQWLLKKPYDGAAIKDAVYGANYQGGTAAANYVEYCKGQGVTLSPLNGEPAQLVADIRFWIGQQQPLIATEPDPYANASLGWTHVVAFYGADTPPGTLTCLDPYGGHPVTLSDAEWIARLQFKQVWKLERIPMSGVPQGWHMSPDGTALICPSSTQGGPEVEIKGRIMAYVLANNWDYRNVALAPSEHKDVLELSNTSLGSGWQQTFRYAMLGIPDTGPRAGEVIWEWTGQELEYTRKLLAQAQAEIGSLQTQLIAGEATIANLRAQPAGLDPAKVADRLTALAQLGHQVEALATQAIG